MPRINKILIRSGTIPPTASDFVVGEPAFDKNAGRLYLKSAAGVMVDAAGPPSLVTYATASALPATGTEGVLYLVADEGGFYYWTSSAYAEAGGSPIAVHSFLLGGM
jgi:hypothetical protein